MNVKELQEKLEKHNVIESFYSLTPPHPNNECLCLNHENDSWVVFFMERGKRWNENIFLTENDACEYFLRESLVCETNKKI